MATSLPPNVASLGAHEKANQILAEDASKTNAVVHTFDPDLPPEQKAAAAGKGREQLTSKIDDVQNGIGGREVAIDTGNKNVVPTITIEDVDNDIKSGQQPAISEEEAGQPPGAIPTRPASAIPDWYKVGWRAFTDLDKPQEEPDEQQKRMLQSFISEQYYGEWYHNAALVLFAVLATHFLTRFHFGWGWLFIILAFCNTYYMTSMARVRTRARDDIQRELVKTRLASEHESAEWLNHFLERFWLIYEPVLSQTIVASVDQVLSTSCPTFLESIRLSSFTLGSKAPRIDKVRTFPTTAEDIVMMDWGVSFTPNDLSDLTPRQQAMKSNPKVVLTVRVGKGVASAAMPILVEDMTFSGLMRIRMKLMTSFPHVQVVDISFLEKPLIDFVLKPIGGETFGFDIANVPGLSSFIRDMIHSTLDPMMYDPNVFTLNLEQLLSGAPLDTAVGVIKVTVYSARSIKASKIGGGTPDPYVSLSINNRGELAKTKMKSSTYNPVWNETKFILVNSLKDHLVLSVLDYNEHRKDTELGAALFELSKLEEDATQEGLELPILRDGKEKGELRFDVTYFPVLQPQINESGVQELPETSVGIVRFVVHQAKDLDTSKVHTSDLSPFVKVYVGGKKPIYTTPRVKHTLQPVWESATEFLCTDRASSIITVKVIDDRDFLKDPTVGYAAIRLDDLLEARKEAGRDWWPLSDCKSGRIRMSAEWKPLNMAGSLHGADRYVPPIGVVRLWLQKATDVKNVEAALGGKSDPYVRVLVNGTIQARTEVINNNLNPEWDQIIYTPVHSARETMLLEVMDYQHMTKDRSLGTVELKVSELVQQSDDPQYRYASTGKIEKADPIRLDRGKSFKGHLHYIAEFVPALAVKGVSFESNAGELKHAIDEQRGESPVDSASSPSSSSDHLPSNGVTAQEPLSNGGYQEETDSSSSTPARGTSPETVPKSVDSQEKKEPEGIELSKEELLNHQSGVIVFNVKSGRLNKKGRLEVLLDDGYWPAFSTVRANGHNASWEHVGEGFLKELDFGRVWLRLNEADEGDKDDIIGEWKGNAKAFLETAMERPTSFTLRNQDNEDVATVEIEARYVPVPVVLEPRESINNQGVLRVGLIDGHGIRGVDRGGKSDPFVVFSLNGHKVFKSQTKKKTLNPEWHEDFTVSVPSRVAADFSLEVFDWNQIEQAKSLGSAKIYLEDVEPFNGIERTLQLSSEKHGDVGEVRITLMFQPEIIAKARKNTSTFSAAGRAMTTLGSIPVGAGKGVFNGVKGVFKRDKDDDDDDIFTSHAEFVQRSAPHPPGGQMSQPVGVSDHAGANGAVPARPPTHASLPSLPESRPESGTLRVLVLDAKDLSANGDSIKPYATIRVGDKEHKTRHVGKTFTPEWNEQFSFSVNQFTPRLYAWIYDHKTLGKDKLVGEAEVDIWQHVQPTPGSAADVFVELQEGQGLLRLRLEYDIDTTSEGRKSNVSTHDLRSPQPISPSRFSIRGKRPGSDND